MANIISTPQALHSSVILPALLLILTVALIKNACEYFSASSRRLRSLPRVWSSNDGELRTAITRAFREWSKAGDFYKLGSPVHETIIIPPKYMGELKALPESKLSFKDEIRYRLSGDLTGLGFFEPSFIKTMTGDLSKRIPRLMGELSEETDYAFKSLVGEGTDGRAIAMLPAAQKVIALLSSRVFVGLSVSRREDWLEAMIKHTNYTFGAGVKLWKYPAFLRNIVAPYLKEFKDMAANKKLVEQILAPEIALRQQATLSGTEEDNYDILQCLVHNAPAEKRSDVSYHALMQLQMSVAGIHTTASMLTYMIFNLIAYPEIIPELVAELHEHLGADESWDNTLILTKSRLNKCIKLDSFMKETQRLTPLSLTSMNRRINSSDGVTLSNGMRIPEGSFTAVNSHAIMNDPNLYLDPEKFDPWRFSKLVAQGGLNATKYQFTTVNPEFMAFGQGVHSCPGRFFAAAEIKTALIYVMLSYDVAFEPGKTKPDLVTDGFLQNPDGKAKVVFTPKKDAWNLVGESD